MCYCHVLSFHMDMRSQALQLPKSMLSLRINKNLIVYLFITMKNKK